MDSIQDDPRCGKPIEAITNKHKKVLGITVLLLADRRRKVLTIAIAGRSNG